MSNIAQFISGSGPGSWNHRFNTSQQLSKISKRFRESTNEINYGKEIQAWDWIRKLNDFREEVNPLLEPPKDDSNTLLQSEQGEVIAKVVQDEAANQFVKMFYSMYMSSNNSDIKWRLGNVTGTMPTFIRAPGTTKEGLIYTASNFNQSFKIRSYSSKTKSVTSYEEVYSNFWFPPYTNFGTTTKEKVLTLSKWVNLREKALRGDEDASNELDKEKNNCYFDSPSMINFRGNFTYRKIAFKPLNDNIMFLQWLFERVSGIVSTYLTDWDLSIYLQEGLVSQDRSSPQWISLVHRIHDDCPIPNLGIHALNFGVINAAVSKLFGSNKEIWDPSEYPLSPFWIAYPSWENREHSRVMKVNVNGQTVAVPRFYYDAKDPDVGTNRAHPFISRIQWDDFQGAALAGWTVWQLYYWKALYCNESDGLNEADILALNAGSGYTKANDIIDENLYNNWYVTDLEDQVYSDGIGNDMNDIALDMGGGGGGGDYKSGGRAAAKLLSSRSSKNNAAYNAANNASLQKRLGFSEKDGTAEARESFLGVQDDSKDSAKGTGICQRNPPLYGGPHGAAHSPLTIQSYLEANNTWLRNIPRIAPWDLGYKEGKPQSQIQADTFDSSNER